MALPGFYNQGDQDIYASGDKFIPQEQYRLGYTAPPSIANAPTTGITNTQAAASYMGYPSYQAWLAAQGGGGGGGDGPGGGLFGNLDLSNTKMFDKNVWSDTTASGKPIGPPGQFDWTPQQVQGYYNPQLGQYQTFKGKNINHAGINIQPMFASLLGLDKKGPKPGDIEGTFTKGWESGTDKIKEGWEDEKEKFKNIGVLKQWRENKAIKKEAALQAEIKAHNDAAAAKVNTNILSPSNPLIGKIDHTGAGSGHGSITRAPGSVVAGAPTHRTRDDLMASGGRAGYNRGRVVNPGGYRGDEEFEEFEDENTLDFMRDQGVPYGEMAEKSPFEMRIDELMDTGMSWQEAYDIASDEFNQLAEGQENSFSEEGLASLV